jgi:hypothetical protein
MSKLSSFSPFQAKATKFPFGDIAGSNSNPGKRVMGTGLAAGSIGAAVSRLSPAHTAAPSSASASIANTARRTCCRRPHTGSAGAAVEASGGVVPDRAADKPGREAVALEALQVGAEI